MRKEEALPKDWVGTIIIGVTISFMAVAIYKEAIAEKQISFDLDNPKLNTISLIAFNRYCKSIHTNTYRASSQEMVSLCSSNEVTAIARDETTWNSRTPPDT